MLGNIKIIIKWTNTKKSLYLINIGKKKINYESLRNEIIIKKYIFVLIMRFTFRLIIFVSVHLMLAYNHHHHHHSYQRSPSSYHLSFV